jgi:hypothetical protein
MKGCLSLLFWLIIGSLLLSILCFVLKGLYIVFLIIFYPAIFVLAFWLMCMTIKLCKKIWNDTMNT